MSFTLQSNDNKYCGSLTLPVVTVKVRFISKDDDLEWEGCGLGGGGGGAVLSGDAPEWDLQNSPCYK